ncbi:hypothetical protein IW136_003917, partial [Coemansia sp. RSA 678]
MGRDTDEEHSRHRSRHRSRSPSRRSRRESLSPSSRKSRRHTDKESRSKRRSDSREDHKKKRSSSSRHKSRRNRDGSDEESEKSKTPDDPLADPALSKKFVWKKKVEQDRAKGLSRAERDQIERERRAEAERELESLRKRRELREIEHAQREEELSRQRREQEQEKLGDWERREEEFHLVQAKRRAEIRIKNQRPKPIDVLAMNLRLANEPMRDEEVVELGMMRVDTDEPHRMVECLDEGEARELAQDVEMYLSLESIAQNVEFWENMAIVVNVHVDQLRSGRAGIRSEVRGILDGKSLGELAELETDVQAKLAGEQGAVDVDYWGQVREELG